MKRRALLIALMSLMPAQVMAQAKKRFMLPGPGSAILLETTTTATNPPYAALLLENCTPNVADNNCWILLETNTPGWTGHP